MTFKEIYCLTIKYYPSEIDISDGKMVKKNSGNFKTLNDSWDKAELKAKNDSNLVQLMVWGIFRTYHKKAIDNFLNGIMTVSVTELDIKYLKSSFTENLLNLNIQLN